MIETSDLCNSAGYQSLSIERPRPTETTRNREGCRFVQSNPVKQTFGRGGKPDGQTEERDPDCGRGHADGRTAARPCDPIDVRNDRDRVAAGQ